MAIRFRAVLVVLALSAVLLALLVVGLSPRKTVLTVGPSGDYRQIQDAINNATDGDTIAVSSGTYHEKVAVDKRLSIAGVDDGGGFPVIDAGGTGVPVHLAADGVYLTGFIITGSGPGLPGIQVDSGGNTIDSCSIYGNIRGIDANGQNDNTISDNDIYCNDNEAILLIGCGNTTVVANDVHECPTGISLQRSNGCRIGQNNVSNNRLYGIRLRGSAGDTIYKNVVRDNDDRAISLEEASVDNAITGNDVSDNTLVDTMPVPIGAIDIDRSDGNSLIGNRVSGQRYGIVIDGSSSCNVQDNVLNGGEACIWMEGSDHNVIENNTMSGAGIADTGGYALALVGSWYNSIANNTLTDNAGVRDSIWLSNASYNTLEGNLDHSNGGEGIWLEDGSVGNRAYLNDFSSGVARVTAGNYWSSPAKIAYTYHGTAYTGYLGNYWAGYRGVDAGGNGVGDVSYAASALTDRYPLAEPIASYRPGGQLAGTAGPYSGVDIGFHEAVYGNGISPNPSPEEWYAAGQDAADKFGGSTVGAVWVIGCARADGSCFLNFPSATPYPNIRFTGTDENEPYLDYFDSKGMRVYLQVEPGNADVDDLIRLVLGRYAHHPCVVGVGIDVEWYRFTSNWKGQAVSDEEAADWYGLISSYNKTYTLALTHWFTGRMPPTYRKGILFLDDAYDFTSLDDMASKFTAWSRAFPDSPVGFYIGFPADQGWWETYNDPYETIGQRLLKDIPNTKGIYWINGQQPRV